MLLNRDDFKRLKNRQEVQEERQEEIISDSEQQLPPENARQPEIIDIIHGGSTEIIYDYEEEPHSLATQIILILLVVLIASNFKDISNRIGITLPTQQGENRDETANSGNDSSPSGEKLKKKEFDPKKLRYMTDEELIQTIAPYAIEIGPKYRVYPSTFLAQFIWETGWGNRKGDEPTVDINNFFGIKADKSWKGKKKLLPTKNDAEKWSWFREYDTPAEGLEAHGKFLNENSIYSEALKCFDEKKGAKEQVRAIAEAGYAEGQDYASNLIGTIEHHNLERFDSMTLEAFLEWQNNKESTVVTIPYEQGSETVVFDDRTKYYKAREEDDVLTM